MNKLASLPLTLLLLAPLAALHAADTPQMTELIEKMPPRNRPTTPTRRKGLIC